MIIVLGALLLLISVYVYVSILRQIASRGEESATERQFGPAEVAVALGLSTLMAGQLFTPTAPASLEIKTGTLLGSIIFTIALVGFLVAFLKLRGFSLTALTGMSRLGFERALVTGIVLIALAYPLVYAADRVIQHFHGGDSSRQEIVELFSNSRSLGQRILVIVLAVAIAPVAEEFVFRFFLYGVLRRYGGRAIGMVLTGLLFAAVHAHLPSFAPLFVLATCLNLAYEWSGSLLVPMTMHSVFNGLTMIALAFPQTVTP